MNMERQFYLAKTVIKDNVNDVLYHLLENTERGLEETIPNLTGGEKEIKVICKELVQMIKERKKLSKPTKPLGGFTLTSIKSITIHVGIDSCLTLFYPLRDEEMEEFYRCYFKVGNYV